VKSAEEIMNVLEAYDLTGSLRDAAELAGCSHHTVVRYVAERGRAVPGAPARRAGVIDEFSPKLEELVERSKGKIRADVAHEKITAMGYAGRSARPERSAPEHAVGDHQAAPVEAVKRPARSQPSHGNRGDVQDNQDRQASVRAAQRQRHQRKPAS
jgi:hypothetical protein